MTSLVLRSSRTAFSDSVREMGARQHRVDCRRALQPTAVSPQHKAATAHEQSRNRIRIPYKQHSHARTPSDKRAGRTQPRHKCRAAPQATSLARSQNNTNSRSTMVGAVDACGDEQRGSTLTPPADKAVRRRARLTGTGAAGFAAAVAVMLSDAFTAGTTASAAKPRASATDRKATPRSISRKSLSQV
jgi:hypothetical protein